MSVMNNLITQKLMNKYGISWFKFDESSGNVTDSKGTAIGTVNGATRVSGISNNALKFDGVNDNVQFNQRIIPYGGMSVRFNVKTTSTSNSGWILGTCVGGTGNGFAVALYGGLQTQLGIRIQSNGSGYTSIIPCVINDGQWHDILIINSGILNNKGLIVYVDDMTIPVYEGNPNYIINAHSYDLFLGSSPANNLFFDGQIDDLQFYNKALVPKDFNLYQSFILDNGEYKSYNPTVSQWETITNTSPSIEQFINQGMEAISPLLDRVNGTSPIDQLSRNYKIETWTNTSNTKLLLESPTPAQIVYPKGDISLLGVESIDKLTLVTTGNAKVGISFDSGTTWKAYKSGTWIELDSIHNGMTVSEINALTNQQIMEVKGDSQFIRFSYSLSGNTEVDNIEMKVSMQGTEKIANTSDYDLSYDEQNSTIVYNIKKSGTYSVNYVT